MRQEKFNELLTKRLAIIVSQLKTKGFEYQNNEDVFHNFKMAARINNSSPQQALWSMATKHLVSIIDIVKGCKPNKQEAVQEKIGDMINYLILLEALLEEERGEDLPFQ